MMKHIFVGHCGLILVLLLISCATGQGASKAVQTAPVYLTNQAGYTLLPPEGMGLPLDMRQRIRGYYGVQEFLLEAWVRADEQALTMTFFNSLGVGMGDLSFDAGGINFSSAFLPASVKPEYIVTDFQLCFYRTEEVAAVLKNIGLILTVEQREEKEIRTISEKSKIIIRIEKDSSSVNYTNYLREYRYLLEGSF